MKAWSEGSEAYFLIENLKILKASYNHFSSFLELFQWKSANCLLIIFDIAFEKHFWSAKMASIKHVNIKIWWFSHK